MDRRRYRDCVDVAAINDDIPSRQIPVTSILVMSAAFTTVALVVANHELTTRPADLFEVSLQTSGDAIAIRNIVPTQREHILLAGLLTFLILF